MELLLACLCMRVCISFHRKGFSWLNKTNVMPEIRPVIMCWGNNSVKYLRRHVIDNHSMDLQASNCARVSIKPERATKNKRQLLKLFKRTTVKAPSIATFLLTNLGSRSATAQRPTDTKRRVALTKGGLCKSIGKYSVVLKTCFDVFMSFLFHDC